MILGSDKTHRMWFNNLEEAREFAKADFRDKPVKHIFNDEN